MCAHGSEDLVDCLIHVVNRNALPAGDGHLQVDHLAAITLQSRETVLIAGDCVDQSDIESQCSSQLVKRNRVLNISAQIEDTNLTGTKSRARLRIA